MAYIYKITNLINSKIYIGETTGSIEQRWSQHKSKAKNDLSRQYHLYCAMRKYGIENFTIEKIEEVEDEQRFLRETYYILKYESYKREKGYNEVIEGSGNSPYNSQDFIDLWKNGLSMKEIAEEMGCHRTTAYKKIHNNISNEEIKQRKGEIISKRDGRPVEQYSLQGQYIKDFPSASACSEEGFSQSAVSSVCSQKQKSAYGYLWKYKDDNRDIQEWVKNYENKKSAGKPKKRIGQYDKQTNELLQIFESGADAARALELLDKSCICRAARTNGNSHGYKWRYLKKDGQI